MKDTLILVTIILTLILSACAPALQAESAVESQNSSPTAAMQNKEQLEPAAGSVTTEMKTPQSGLLLAEWDSKTRKYILFPIDPESGKALPGYEPIPVGKHIYHAVSPDGMTLAFIVFGSSENPVGGSLMLVDTQEWRAQITPLDLDGAVTALDLSPDGTRLAVAHGNQDSQVVVIDLNRQAISARQGLDFLISRLRYAGDGSQVLVYGTSIKNRYTVNEAADGSPQAALLDGDDLNLDWSVELAGVRDGIYPKDGSSEENADLHQPGAAVYDLSGVVFAPDRDALYVVHTALDQLTTVDYEAQKVETVDIRPQLSWLERLLWLTAGVAKAKVAEGASLRAQVSPDGKLLYVVGSKQELIETNPEETMYEMTALGLQIIRIADGTILDRLDSQADDLAVSTDGDRLYLHTWKEKGSETQVVSSRDLEVVAQLEGSLAPVMRMNGEALLASYGLDEQRAIANADRRPAKPGCDGGMERPAYDLLRDAMKVVYNIHAPCCPMIVIDSVFPFIIPRRSAGRATGGENGLDIKSLGY